MKNTTSKFREGDIVRVLPGVKDPDFKTNIGGWSGAVEEIELAEDGPWLYMIRWDRKTLARVGADYEDRCEDNNLDYELMHLEEKDLELVESQDGQTTKGVFIA